GFSEQDNLQMHELPVPRFGPDSFRDERLRDLAAMLIAEPDKEAMRKMATDEVARKKACAATVRSRLRSISPHTIELLEMWLDGAHQGGAPNAVSKVSTEDVKQTLSDAFNALIQGEPLDEEDGFRQIRDGEAGRPDKDHPACPNIAALIERQPKIPLFPFK